MSNFRTYFSMILFSASLVQAASADEYHYNNMLIGDRASGLGGAYIAVADDPSGLYYNPAGVVYAASSNLSASMNAYNINKTTHKKVLGDQDWIRESSLLVPNFFGMTQPMGPGTLGFSYAVVDSSIEDQDQTFTGIPFDNTKFTINFNNQDTTIKAGPSYAMTLSRSLSIGFSLYAYNREQEQAFNQIFDNQNSTGNGNDYSFYHWENAYLARTEYGAAPKLGLMYSPVEGISLGLTIEKTFVFDTQIVKQYSCASTLHADSLVGTSCNTDQLVRIEQKFHENNEFPLTIGMGAAWFVNNALMLSASSTYHTPINGATAPTINGALGLEWYISDSIALRMGSYTNFANTPKMVDGVQYNFTDHIDMLGGSFSLTSFTRSSSLSVGVNGSYGQGKSQVVDGVYSLSDVVSYSLTAFMSAGYSY